MLRVGTAFCQRFASICEFSNLLQTSLEYTAPTPSGTNLETPISDDINNRES